MSRRSLVPTLKEHANGSAYCKWRGVFRYFGPWRNPDMAAFHAFIKEVSQPATTEQAIKPGSRTVSDLIEAYISAKEKQYLGSEYKDNLKKYRFRWKQAYTLLVSKYGHCLVTDFGPKSFKDVRKLLSKDKRSRTYVNDLAAEIRLAFQWGVGEELVPVEIAQALMMVKVLRPGEIADMPEGVDVQPVPIETVQATLPFLCPPVAAIVELMTLTVSRPGEIARISADAIEKNGPSETWVYRPSRHKMTWKGKPRFLVFNKEAQVILNKWWKSRGYFFINDRTGYHYTSEQIRNAIEHACRRAGLPYWFPYQIRHATYSETSRKHGTEAAALLAGHTTTKMSQRYDHSKIEKAAKYSA